VEERAKGEPSKAESWLPDAEEERRFLEAVRIGIEQADRGEFIEEAEMDARVERMLSSLR
jgi:predicted transcriptional regulator